MQLREGTEARRDYNLLVKRSFCLDRYGGRTKSGKFSFQFVITLLVF